MKHFLIQLLLVSFLLSENLVAQNLPEQPIPGEMIVYFAPQTDVKNFIQKISLQKAKQAANLYIKKSLGKKHVIYLIGFQSNEESAEKILAYIRQQPEVIAAQFNYEVHFRQIPNDPEYDKQWGLERIGASRVWDYGTGGVTILGDTIVVAILDSGFDTDHEDLKQNIWRNSAELPDDGLDNDENGYIDDLQGWNFIDDMPDFPSEQHGTSVIGIIGANGNNGIGVSGLSWNAKMMLLSTQKVDQIVAAYEYIIDQRERYNRSMGAEGAFVVATNASLGQDRKFCKDQPVWGAMYDLMGEVGILTGAGTANSNWDVEEVGDMPTTCTSDYILTCLNVTPEDVMHTNTAYGNISIDLGAPGQNSFTTKASNNYGEFGGNSAAAPHLTGAIALLYSLPCENLAESALAQPVQTALMVREAILKGVDALSDLEGKTVTGGRLNVFRSMEMLQNLCNTSNGNLAISNLYPNPTDDYLFVEYQTPDFEKYELRIFNTLGQLMYLESITPPRFSVKKQYLNLPYLSAGIYFLTLSRNETVVQHKFIVH